MLNHLKHASYESLLNDIFQIPLDDGGAVDLQLKYVSDLKSHSPKYDSFSIEFQGPHDFLLPQRIYPLTHDKMGAFSLFLVPVEEVADGYIYQAVFNVTKDEDVDQTKTS